MTTYITQDHEYTAHLEQRTDELSVLVDDLRRYVPEVNEPVYFDVKIWASEAHMAADLLREWAAPNLPLRILPGSVMHESKWLWCRIAYTGPRAEVYPAIYGGLIESVTTALEEVGRSDFVDVTVRDITLHAVS